MCIIKNKNYSVTKDSIDDMGNGMGGGSSNIEQKDKETFILMKDKEDKNKKL